MKHTNQNSPIAASFTKGQPSSSYHATVEQMRGSTAKGSPIRFGKLRDRVYDPIADKQINYEVAERPAIGDPTKRSFVTAQSGKVVAGLSGCKAAGLSSETVKRFKVTLPDRITGEPKEVMCKLITRKVDVICYGKVFHFTKTNRGMSILDSRDGSRKSQSFVKAELSRMLGATEGSLKFAELMGA